MALWTPSRITTTLWLDASDASTLYDATSGGSLVAANGTVARWEDKSGNVRHVTQATSGNRPLRKTAIQNSLDIIRFDGTNDLLETTFAAFGTSYAVVAVAKATSVASAGVILSCRSKTQGRPINPSLYPGSSVINADWRDDANNSNFATAGSVSNNTWFLAGCTRNGSSVAAYTNATAGTTLSTTLGTTTTTVTSIGALYPGTSTPNTFLNGDIAEIVVCSLADRVITEGYLAWKWGIQANLPSGHPYLSAAPSYGGSSPINSQSLIRPADSKPYQQLIGV